MYSQFMMYGQKNIKFILMFMYSTLQYCTHHFY